MSTVIFGGAEPNPTDLNVRAGLKVYKENKCDMLVSLGGGSSHDCAKGIGIVATNGGDIREYAGDRLCSQAFAAIYRHKHYRRYRQ